MDALPGEFAGDRLGGRIRQCGEIPVRDKYGGHRRVFGRVVENFARMWREFLTVHFYVSGMALVGLYALWREKVRLPVLMTGLWLLAATAAIATLDNAFWHFKHYPDAVDRAVLPAGGVGLGIRVHARATPAAARVAAARGVSTGGRGGDFRRADRGEHGPPAEEYAAVRLSNEALNVGYVAAQPLQMARWLAENTPDETRVAVHDVGMMRYLSRRTTIDMVGLTTPGAATYWRNGPGSVGEFLEQQNP